MNKNYLIKQKHLIGTSNFYYIYTMTYIGGFLLVIPMACATLMAGFQGNYDFFWVGPFFGWIGFYLLATLNYVKSRSRKDLIVRHLLEAGPMVVGVCLYCILLRLNVFGLVGPSEHSIPKASDQIPMQLDLAQNRNHLKIEEIKISPSGELETEGDA